MLSLNSLNRRREGVKEENNMVVEKYHLTLYPLIESAIQLRLAE